MVGARLTDDGPPPGVSAQGGVLVVPAISAANVPQLAVDLLAHTMSSAGGAARGVVPMHDDAVLPAVGVDVLGPSAPRSAAPDAASAAEGVLHTALELYTLSAARADTASPERGAAPGAVHALQLRAPVAPGRGPAFAERTVRWTSHALGCRLLLLLHSEHPEQTGAGTGALPVPPAELMGGVGGGGAFAYPHPTPPGMGPGGVPTGPAGGAGMRWALGGAAARTPMPDALAALVRTIAQVSRAEGWEAVGEAAMRAAAVASGGPAAAAPQAGGDRLDPGAADATLAGWLAAAAAAPEDGAPLAVVALSLPVVEGSGTNLHDAALLASAASALLAAAQGQAGAEGAPGAKGSAEPLRRRSPAEWVPPPTWAHLL